MIINIEKAGVSIMDFVNIVEGVMKRGKLRDIPPIDCAYPHAGAFLNPEEYVEGKFENGVFHECADDEEYTYAHLDIQYYSEGAYLLVIRYNPIEKSGEFVFVGNDLSTSATAVDVAKEELWITPDDIRHWLVKCEKYRERA